VERAPVAVLALEAGMMDFGALWLRSQIRTGETAIALRSNGHDWRSIAATLSTDVDTVRRAAALFLSSDLATRLQADTPDAQRKWPVTGGPKTILSD
jgi:c-di-AMP phosphodiesterase-like protein